MPSAPTDPLDQAQRELAAWHSTHPDATFAEIEVAVEGQIERLRTHLLDERTESRAGEGRPPCRKCGTTMVLRVRGARTLILRGDQQLKLKRDYVVCPRCGAGLFPPG